MGRATLFVIFTLASTQVLAGGFEFSDNGAQGIGRAGAFVAKARDLSALHYNPAGLAHIKGVGFFYSHNFSKLDLSFTRADHHSYVKGFDPETMSVGLIEPEGSPISFPAASNESGWFLPAAMMVASYDFGLEDFSFALGLFGPAAMGQSEFPLNETNGDYDPTNPVKYTLIKKDILMVFYTAAVAWKISDRYAVGLDLQYVDMSRLYFDMMVDGDKAGIVHPINSGWDVRAKMDVADRFGFTATLGFWGRPWDFLEFGVSSRMIPVKIEGTGEVGIGLTGDTISMVQDWGIADGPGGTAHTTDATVSFTLPPWVRAGVRYIHGEPDDEIFDIEVDVVYEFWSMFDKIDVDMQGYLHLRDELNEGVQLSPITLTKNWEDVISVRVGGDVRVIRDLLWLRAGGMFETAAMPQAYTAADFEGLLRYGASAGFTVRLWQGIKLHGAYLFMGHEQREVSEDETEVYQQRPCSTCTAPYDDPNSCDPYYQIQEGWPGTPVGAGKYEQTIHQVSVALEATF
jgi:long-subunit fatty acid transport protein